MAANATHAGVAGGVQCSALRLADAGLPRHFIRADLQWAAALDDDLGCRRVAVEVVLTQIGVLTETSAHEDQRPQAPGQARFAAQGGGDVGQRTDGHEHRRLRG